MFQTLNKNHRLSGEAISRRDMLRIVKERCATAELPESICNHTFRGTGITVFLQNGGSLEAAQDMANHSDPRTTKLYDRRKDLASLSEIERRIAFEGGPASGRRGCRNSQISCIIRCDARRCDHGPRRLPGWMV